MITSVLLGMEQNHAGNQLIFPLTPVRSINFGNRDKCLQNSGARQQNSSKMIETEKNIYCEDVKKVLTKIH